MVKCDRSDGRPLLSAGQDLLDDTLGLKWEEKGDIKVDVGRI